VLFNWLTFDAHSQSLTCMKRVLYFWRWWRWWQWQLFCNYQLFHCRILCIWWFRQFLQVSSRHTCIGFRLVSEYRSSLEDSATKGAYATLSVRLPHRLVTNYQLILHISTSVQQHSFSWVGIIKIHLLVLIMKSLILIW